MNNRARYDLSLPKQNSAWSKIVTMDAENGPLFEIRPATLKDVNEIGNLCAELGYPTSPEQIEEILEVLNKRTDHVAYVIEIKNGSIVGWVHAYLRWLLMTGLSAEVGGIVIQEAYRRQGLGKKLLQQIETWACRQGCQIVELHSGMQRDIAHEFYPSIGYTRIKSSWKYEKKLTGE